MKEEDLNTSAAGIAWRAKHIKIADMHIPRNDRDLKHYQVYDACDAVAEWQLNNDIEKIERFLRDEAEFGTMRHPEDIEYVILRMRKAMEEER